MSSQVISTTLKKDNPMVIVSEKQRTKPVETSTNHMTEFLTALNFQQLGNRMWKGTHVRLRPVDVAQKTDVATIRARTMLNIALDQRMMSTSTEEIWVYDPIAKDYFLEPVLVMYWEGDKPLIDWTINMGKLLIDNPNKEDLWNGSSADDYDDLYPEVAEADIRNGTVKASLAHNPIEKIGWMKVKGWLYIYNPKLPEDLLAVTEFLSQSNAWLNSETHVRNSEDTSDVTIRSPQGKKDLIITQRLEGQKFVATTLAVLNKTLAVTAA